MLIAAEKGARLIVSVGAQYNLVEFLDRNRQGMSSTFLTRLRIGEILVDAKGVSRLYQPRPGPHAAPGRDRGGHDRDDRRDLDDPGAARRRAAAVDQAPPAARHHLLTARAGGSCSTIAITHSRWQPSCSRSRSGVLIGVAIGDSNLVSSAKSGIVSNLNSEVSASRKQASELQQRLSDPGNGRQGPLSALGPRTAGRAQHRPRLPRRNLRRDRHAGPRRRHAVRRRRHERGRDPRAAEPGRRSATKPSGTRFAAARRLRRRSWTVSASSSAVELVSRRAAGRPRPPEPRPPEPAERLRRAADAPGRAGRACGPSRRA